MKKKLLSLFKTGSIEFDITSGVNLKIENLLQKHIDKEHYG